jgi:hypothetical protein
MLSGSSLEVFASFAFFVRRSSVKEILLFCIEGLELLDPVA